MKKREYILDFLKGIAIYLVVVNHLANALWGANCITQMIALVHLPLFFVVSGYLFNITRKKRTFKEIIIGKTKTLLWPYFIWSLVALVVAVVLNRTFDIAFILNQISEIFIYARSVWFLLILYFISIFFAICFGLIKNQNGICKIICMITLYVILCVILPKDIFQLFKFKAYTIYFALGIGINEYIDILKGYYIKIRKLKIYIPIFFLLGAMTVVNSSYANFMVLFEHESPNLLLVMLVFIITIIGMLSMVILAEFCKNTSVFNMFSEFGFSSLDIYVMHMFFVKVLTVVLFKLKLSYALYVVLIFILGFMVSVIIAKLKKYILGKSRLYNFCIGK